MNTLKNSLTFLFLATTVSVFGQKINSQWKNTLSTSIETFKKCEIKTDAGINQCSTAISESINKVYMIDDFYSKEKERFMTSNEIIANLKTSNQWKLLGYAYEQNILTQAQEYANVNKAVLAVYQNEEQLGNVSLILPGELSKSGSWGFDVPNSATFFVNDPNRSYLDKALSYAYSRSIIRKVSIYGRNY
jgi:hypothetical protein